MGKLSDILAEGQPEEAVDCMSCRFWREIGEFGQCRRRAPIAKLEGDIPEDSDLAYHMVARFPMTTAEDWCGEAEPKR